MAKRIYISGRFESVEQGNVVAGANAILDDTKGKKQNVINSETDAELLRLQNEKQDNLTFDNAPTENSNNPVKSGGVYSANLALQAAIEAILLLIPNAASALNKLVDEAQMNDKISTASATFRGTYTSVQALDNVQGDANDYAYVSTTDAAGNSTYDKYKYVEGTGWVFEYKLNNNAFTATEWAAIQSGITAALVGKLTDLPTAEQLITTFAGKEDVLTFDDVPTLGSNNPVKSSGIKTELNTKQPTLVVGTNLDASPTEDSTNPVTSGGVWTAINAIAVKISAEASSSNQLADKAWVVSSIAAAILAAIPSFKGQFTSLADLLLVESPKDGDLGIVRTTDSDGYAVFTMYQFLNDTWNVFYTLSHHNLKKPATTGITGDYPYNGMGKVVLEKNIVGGVNTLTQDMFYKGEVGSRVPNTNTVFVVQYDFVLGEDITIPANCVLEFDGGSISGGTITGNNTQIKAQDVAIFKSGIIIAGTWICPHISSDWFDDITSDNRLRQLINLCSDSIYNTVAIKEGNYTVSVLDRSDIALSPKSNTDLLIAGTINMQANAFDGYRMIGIVNKENIRIIGIGGSIVGDLDNHDFSGGLSSYEWCHGIGIGGGAKNITVDGLLISKCPGDGIDVTDWADQTEEALNYDITIKNCEISYCGRQGVTLANGINNIVSNMYIHHIGNTTAAPSGPGSAIDIEPMWHVCENVFISNIKIANCTRGIMSVSSLNINIHVDNVSGDGIAGAAFEISASTVRISNSKFINTSAGIETGDDGHVIIENSEIHASTTYVIITWADSGSIYANKCKFINDTENAANVVLNLHYNTTIMNSVLSAYANLSGSSANNFVLKNNTINCNCYVAGDNCIVEHNIINGASTVVGNSCIYKDNTSYTLYIETTKSSYKNNTIVGNLNIGNDKTENEIENNYIEGRVYIGVGAARTVLKRNNIKLTEDGNYAITFGGAADGSEVVENKVTSIVNFRGIYNVAGGSAAKEILHKGNIYDTTGVTVVMIDNTKVWRNYCEGGAANTNLPTTYLAIGDTHTGNDGKTVFYTPAGWKYADGIAI